MLKTNWPSEPFMYSTVPHSELYTNDQGLINAISFYEYLRAQRDPELDVDWGTQIYLHKHKIFQSYCWLYRFCEKIFPFRSHKASPRVRLKSGGDIKMW